MILTFTLYDRRCVYTYRFLDNICCTICHVLKYFRSVVESSGNDAVQKLRADDDVMRADDVIVGNRTARLRFDVSNRFLSASFWVVIRECVDESLSLVLFNHGSCSLDTLVRDDRDRRVCNPSVVLLQASSRSEFARFLFQSDKSGFESRTWTLNSLTSSVLSILGSLSDAEIVVPSLSREHDFIPPASPHASPWSWCCSCCCCWGVFPTDASMKSSLPASANSFCTSSIRKSRSLCSVARVSA